MQIHLHQGIQTLADTDQIFTYFEEQFIQKVPASGIHLLSELFLTGYPLQDLCLQRTYIKRFNQLLDRIDALSKNKWPKDLLILMGGLKYQLEESSLPIKIENIIYAIDKEKPLYQIYSKRLLPNYDIYDEQKYFTPGDEPGVLKFQDKTFALLICEDMWHSSTHEIDPVAELSKLQIKFDGIFNLSASPFHIGKKECRHRRAKEISSILEAPFFYVNRLAAEDEIIFDGSSFTVNGDNLNIAAKSFKEDLISVELEEFCGTPSKLKSESENTWESLFDPALNFDNKLPSLQKISQDHYFQIFESLRFGFTQYAQKCGFKNFTVALSGGVDSALVLALVKLFLKEGQTLEAIYMPSIYSREISWELSYEMCEKIGIKLKSLPIKFFHSAIKNGYLDTFKSPLEGLADENIQSRLRGSLLYARSNHTNSMVINTSNKSELAVGYSTLYGDSVGAISLLGDLYKSEVFGLSDFVNAKFAGIIPQGIIDRAPSAELRDDQEDAQSLPAYERLDAILEGLLSYRMDTKDLIESGFSKEEVDKVYQLYTRSEYKRRQFCPIIKLKPKSFGFGYRVPICKK